MSSSEVSGLDNSIIAVLQFLKTHETPYNFIISMGLKPTTPIQFEVIKLLVGKTQDIQVLRQLVSEKMFLFHSETDVSKVLNIIMDEMDVETRNLFTMEYAKEYHCSCESAVEATIETTTSLKVSTYPCVGYEDLRSYANQMLNNWGTVEVGELCPLCDYPLTIKRTLLSMPDFMVMEVSDFTALPLHKGNPDAQSINLDDYEIVTAIRRYENDKWQVFEDKNEIDTHGSLLPYLGFYRILLFQRLF